MALRPEQPLPGTAEVRVGIALPASLSARLDALVRRANQQGARTNRKELLAGLLLVAEPDPKVLAETVRRFRMARIEDTLIPGEPDAPFLDPEPAQPGPRPSVGEE